MENRKIQYQLDRLPMLLFIACLAITVVADSNVTEGKQFWIRCRAEPPISWYKDGEPIEKQFVRDGEDEFTYTTNDHLRDDLTGKVESKLSVSRAVLRHKGKYQCNINHDNSHHLHVEPAPVVVDREEIDEGNAAFVTDDDQEDERMSFVRQLEELSPTISAVLTTYTSELTELSRFSSSDSDTNEETVLNYDGDESHEKEKYIDGPKVSISITTTSSPSLTNIPLHPTHANYVVHKTHEVPSEVQTQNHPEKHRHKGKITPKYLEGERTGYKLFKIGRPLVLTCASDNAAENDKIVWSRTDENNVRKNVREFSDIKDRLKISSKESTLSIERSRDDDAGNYTCSLSETDAHTFNVYATVIVQVPRYVYGVEEEKLEIECNVRGTNPMISWEHRTDTGNESYPVREDNDRIKMVEYKNIEDAKLIIEKANLSDRGYYTCVGWNDLMKEDRAKDIAYARVKDKLAALWPFLGICAEVFVLCAIILIYEKRRNKTDLEESDTDQSPDQKNDLKDTDVRHRK